MTLTHDIYGQRKLDLVRGIELAEGEFHSAALKEQTGSGTPADTKAAKDHLDKLRADLEALEGAWLAAKAQSAREWSGHRQAAFDQFVAECSDLLATRRTAVLAAQAAAAKVAEAIASYEDASRKIKALSAPFHGFPGEAGARMNALTGLDLALDPANWVASMVAGATIGDAGVHLFTSMRTVDVFGKLTAVEFEDKNATRVRSALAHFAPREG